MEITPWSFRQKSPNALAMANPGELYFGSQTRATSGSSGSANILPLRCLILCASPENYHVIPQQKTKRHTLIFFHCSALIVAMESMKILPSDSPKYDVLKVIFNNLCSFSFVFAGSMLSNFQKFYTNMFKSIKIELIKIQLLYLPFFSRTRRTAYIDRRRKESYIDTHTHTTHPLDRPSHIFVSGKAFINCISVLY